MQPMLPAPGLTHVFDLAVEVAQPVTIGETGSGIRRIIDITGGTLSGPELSGAIRPGGADFQIIRANGLAELTALYSIELSDGAQVYVENRGIRFGPKMEIDKLMRGEPADWTQIYFRCAPRFETAAPQHQWLMTHLFIGAGIREPRGVRLSIFKVE